MRLRKRREYTAVQNNGARVHGSHFIAVVARPAAGAPSGRAGITVSRRVGNAVLRNRVKRLVREALRHEPWVGCDVVIIAKRSVASLDGAAMVRRELARMRSRSGSC